MSGYETDLSPDLQAALERVRTSPTKAAKQLTFDLAKADADRVTELLGALVHAAELSPEERVEALASAFAMEAVRGRDDPPGDAANAHAKLRIEDDDLARAIEALAPWLLARLEARQDAEAAVVAVEDLLRDDPFS